MTLKNTGTKIISVGSAVLMPDAEMNISKDIAETPAIKAFARLGLVKIENDNKKPTVKTTTADTAAPKNTTETK